MSGLNLAETEHERLFPEGMMQSSVVLASLVYHAAIRDELLPRIAPLPWK